MGPGRSRRDRQFVGTGAEQRRAETLTLRGGAWELGGAARPRCCPFPQGGEIIRVLLQTSTRGFASEGQNFCGGFSALRRMPGSGFLG